MDISSLLRKYIKFTEHYSVRLLTYSINGACIRSNVMVHFTYNKTAIIIIIIIYIFLSKTKYILVFYKTCGYIRYDRSTSTITT